MAQTQRVAIVMGSDSDLHVMKDAAEILTQLGVDFRIDIVSAHRTPQKLAEFAVTAEVMGFDVIIAGAGGAAHLPGMVAAYTPLPVIGVPIKPRTYTGEDSILSILQMPAGVPVATVALNGAKNAGILAAQILSASDKSLRGKITAYKEGLEIEVGEKSKKLGELGYAAYLAQMPKK